MNTLITIAVLAALLGSALVGGVFFAFSSFVMKALARVPSQEGIAAMQSINIVVINRSFLGVFMGTAVLALVLGLLLLPGQSQPATMFFVGAAACYFIGTFLVTVMGNVPLNNQLATVATTDPGAVTVWRHYLKRWTMWNHVRTAAAMAAALLFALGLVQDGGIHPDADAQTRSPDIARPAIDSRIPPRDVL